jgi:hypothetical protein
MGYLDPISEATTPVAPAENTAIHLAMEPFQVLIGRL